MCPCMFVFNSCDAKWSTCKCECQCKCSVMHLYMHVCCVRVCVCVCKYGVCEGVCARFAFFYQKDQSCRFFTLYTAYHCISPLTHYMHACLCVHFSWYVLICSCFFFLCQCWFIHQFVSICNICMCVWEWHAHIVSRMLPKSVSNTNSKRPPPRAMYCKVCPRCLWNWHFSK